MNRDEILRIYDPWYAENYDERFHGGDLWNDNLGGYKIDIVGQLLADGGRWVDVGCGTGKHLSAFPDVEREGLDLSPHMVEQARAANPGVTITEGSYLDDRPQWVEQWDLVTNLWLSYQFVDSLKLLEQAVANMASWVKPSGAMFMHVADAEDVARGVKLPWVDEATPVFGDALYVTSVTWTWQESNGRTHHDLVAPQLQRMVNILARHFEYIEVHRWPAIDPESALGRPKGIVGRRKRATPLDAAEVGDHYPYTLTYPPRDHPREQDPRRPGDPDFPEATSPPLPPAAEQAVEAVGAQVDQVRQNLDALTTALFPPPDPDRYDTLAVVHEQVWELRREMAELHQAVAASGHAAPAVQPSGGPPLASVSTRGVAKELARRIIPFRRRRPPASPTEPGPTGGSPA